MADETPTDEQPTGEPKTDEQTSDETGVETPLASDAGATVEPDGPIESPDPAPADPAPAGDPEPAVGGVAVAEDEDAAGEDVDEFGDPLPELNIGAAVYIDGELPELNPLVRGKVDRFGVALGTGRRKTSVARVRIKSGDGKIEINGRPLEEYLSVERDQKMVLAPLEATGTLGKVDVWVKVKGGGTTGQTGAIVLGIARALEAHDPSLHGTLSEGHFLTRDERMVERKKYGLAKARRSFQFSKR